MNDDDYRNSEALRKKIEWDNACPRQYSSFFGFTKTERELNAIEGFTAALEARGDPPLQAVAQEESDPPDFTASLHDGRRIAIEVTEIVCSEAILADIAVRKQEKQEVEKKRQQYPKSKAEVDPFIGKMRVWRPGDLTSAIASAIESKDAKKYHGGPFAEQWLCLFTDEPMLTVESAEDELGRNRFGPLQQINRAFLLFSYRGGHNPLIELDVSGH
jgi:hypothetical protein